MGGQPDDIMEDLAYFSQKVAKLHSASFTAACSSLVKVLASKHPA